MSTAEPTPLFHVAETITRGGTTFEVLEYQPLSGSEPIGVAEQLYTLNRAGVRLRQLRIRLSDDAVRTEPGALQFLRGHVQMESNTGQGSGLGGLMKGALNAARTGGFKAPLGPATDFRPIIYRSHRDILSRGRTTPVWSKRFTAHEVACPHASNNCCWWSNPI